MVRLTGITVTKNDIYLGRLETEIVDTEISTLNGLELLQALLFQAKAAAQTNWSRSNYQTHLARNAIPLRRAVKLGTTDTLSWWLHALQENGGSSSKAR